MGTFSDSVDQLNNIYKTLEDYQKALLASVSDTTGSVEYPSFQDVAHFLDYSELIRSSLSSQRDMPRYANGPSIETINHASAVLRESVMCTFSKSDYVSRQATESANEAAFYNKQGMFMTSTFQGNSVGGSVA